jgi:hypothetical protein
MYVRGRIAKHVEPERTDDAGDDEDLDAFRRGLECNASQKYDSANQAMTVSASSDTRNDGTSVQGPLAPVGVTDEWRHRKALRTVRYRLRR